MIEPPSNRNEIAVCKICGGESKYFHNGEIMGKYRIQYFRCDECGLIETETPYWLAEAYSEAIADSDHGLIGRNLLFARQTEVILRLFFRRSRRYVDYGGGYGMFVRLMRDAGFEFFRFDKYCLNLFAKGFDVMPGDGPFDLLSAFEVFEHLTDPLRELDKMLLLSRNILFSTCLISKENPPLPGQWWYYAPQTGQHVTLYTYQSLIRLAKSRNLHLCSAGHLHLLTSEPLPPQLFAMLVRFKVDKVLRGILPRKKSLLAADYAKITGYALS